MLARVAAALLFVPSAVIGQSHTTCQQLGAYVTCDTTDTNSSSNPLDYGALIRSGEAAVPSIRPIYPNGGDDSTARYYTHQREKAAGKMIAAGDCAGAEQYALKKGDFALAAKVRDYCRK